MENFVYIDYVDKDEKLASQMCSFLEEKGIKCFYRCRDIPKDDQDNSLFEESTISEASCVVMIVSNNFVELCKQKLLRANIDKCIAFTIDDINLGELGIENVKKINAINHPTKMFGHLLSLLSTKNR